MNRFFNTTGPCDPERHYMLPPTDRLIGASLERYVRDELYWVLHAPRQTGKTTFLLHWMHQINTGGEAVACYVSVERCQNVPVTAEAMPALISAMRKWAMTFELTEPPVIDTDPNSMLNEALQAWAAAIAPLPLVILFDEVDVLEGPAMTSFLRQLRDGFIGRGAGKFPVSIALVGMRDLRDYLVRSKDGVPLNPGSPFNINADSATLGNFAEQDIAALTSQHTAETGQAFGDDALQRIWYYSGGHPWLVNTLCDRLVRHIVPSDSGATIRAAHVTDAKEQIIESRATHIDSLAERLREPRVRKVIEPMITGITDEALGRSDRDVEFCMDLGLVAWNGSLVVANPIYREVIARYLSQNYQDNVPEPDYRWQLDDGSLDMDALMKGFQRFWAWHADIWEERADYSEAFPHLLLMAFLQRIVNGGGTIEREYAAGRGRIDLLIRFGDQCHVVEVKLVHPKRGREATMQQGLEQIGRYADQTGADTRHLVIFDRRTEAREKPWEERLGWQEATTPKQGDPVTVLWC